MRILFNTTFIVVPTIVDEWKQFMFDEHISYLKNDTNIQDVIFTKVDIEQEEGITFSLQVIFLNQEQYDFFFENINNDFVNRLVQKFEGKYLCFSTTMYEIEE